MKVQGTMTQTRGEEGRMDIRPDVEAEWWYSIKEHAVTVNWTGNSYLVKPYTPHLCSDTFKNFLLHDTTSPFCLKVNEGKETCKFVPVEPPKLDQKPADDLVAKLKKG